MSSRRSIRFFKPSKIPKDFICIICHDILHNAMKLPCDHTLCDDCINKWYQRNKTCPICRKRFELNQIKSATKIVVEINKLNVVCKFPQCDWNGPLKKLDTHECNCTFSPERSMEEVLDRLPKYNKEGEEDLDNIYVNLATLLYKKHKNVMEKVLLKSYEDEEKESKFRWRINFNNLHQKKIDNYFVKK